jgi:hypothetical protein
MSGRNLAVIASTQTEVENTSLATAMRAVAASVHRKSVVAHAPGLNPTEEPCRNLIGLICHRIAR